MENKYKRETGQIGGWVMLLIFAAWNIFWITCWAHNDFEFKLTSEELAPTLTLTGIVIFITTILFSLAHMFVFGTRTIRTLEFTIFEFDYWDMKTNQYVKRYDYGRTVLQAHFIFHFHWKNEIVSTTENDIFQRYTQQDAEGYKTESEVMKAIMEVVSQILANRKTVENVKIVNVKTLQVINIEKLIEETQKG